MKNTIFNMRHNIVKSIVLATLMLAGTGEVWGDHEFYAAYYCYSVNGSESCIDWTTGNPPSTSLGTLTGDFVITKAYLKVWDNWSTPWQMYNGGQMRYKINNGSLQYINPSWTKSTKSSNDGDGKNYELQNGSINQTIAYITDASGSYTMNYDWQTWGQNNDSYLFNDQQATFTWQVAPPAVTSLGVSVSGYLAGSGTSADPYLVKSGQSLTFSVSGSQAHTDANSTFKYWLNSGSKQTSGTLNTGSITSTETASAVIHGQYINNSSSLLVGTESTTTVDYKAVSVKDISVYIYVGGQTDAEAQSVEMNGCKPYVGTTQLTAIDIKGYNSSSTNKFTKSGNWLIYTFSNVTKVSDITCARTGANIFTGEITDNVYYKYDGTALSSQCVPYTTPTWNTAPANGAAGGSMTATISNVPDGATVTWSSSATSYATVTSAGVISYVAAGSSTISARITKSASGDNCALDETLSQAITVTSGATVSVERTCAEYVASGVSGQVSAHITFTGTSSAWKYRVKQGWGNGYETDWLDASGTSADWTMNGGMDAENRTYIVELYESKGASTPVSTANFSVTGETAYNTTISAGANGSVSPSGTVYANNNHVHPTITATANSHYHFVNWTSNNTAASVTDDDEAETTVTATAGGYTITANFAPDQYTISYYDQGGGSFSGTQTSAPATHTYGTATTLKIPSKTGYTFGGWYTSSNCSSDAVGNASSASLGATAYTANITLYAKWTEIMPTLTTTRNITAAAASNPSVSGSATTVGYTTTRSITAAAAITGYKLVGWTVTNGTRTDGGAADATTITVRANGGNDAVTVTANYEEDLETTWYLEGANPPFGGWSTDGTMMTKKTGHSTESVAYKSITVSSTSTYEFKLFKSDAPSETPCDQRWYGYGSGETAYRTWEGTGTQEVYTNDCGANSNDHNLQFKPTMAGTYEFKVDYSGTYPQVTVTWPVINTLTASWNSWTTTNDEEATISGDVITFTSAITQAQIDAGSLKFKIIYNGAHYGKNSTTVTRNANTPIAVSDLSTSGSDITLTADVPGDYIFAFNTSDKSLTVTYPTAYTVTFGYGTGGSAVTATVEDATTITSGQYAAAGKGITFTQTPATGYTFKGWYTTADGSTAVSGMGVNDHVLDDIAADATVYAQYTPNNYTVTFDYTTNGGAIGELNGATNSSGTVTKSVTYASTYGTLPTATKSAKVFAGWWTTASDSPTPGTQVTAETIVGITANQTLYARFEDTYVVTIQYKCGDDVLYPSSSTSASASVLAPTITAPEIIGYQFSSWSGDNATFDDADEASTTVNVTAATTITANYTAVPTVYFKNNLDWDSVFVTFDCSWSTVDGKQVPSNNGHPYFKMNQLGSSDVFYCTIPDSICANSYAKWKWNIAFDNQNYNTKATDVAHTGNMESFYQGEFLGRGDFDPSATMYIPYDGDTETRNGGTYYRTGCWMKYNSTDPGYKIYANTYVEGSGGSAVSGTPVLLTADIAGGFEFKAKVNFPTANYSYGFMLHKEYTKNNNDVWYTNTGAIYSNTTSLPWPFYTNDASENGRRCTIHTEAVGDYTFTVSFGTGRPVVNVEYPVSVDDYQLVYNDRGTWTPANGKHTASWQHPSRVIKAAANAEDIISFFVAPDSTASIKLHKCESIDGSGNPTWDTGTDVSLSGITETGIYNFKVTQDESKDATVTLDGGYEGNYYIRVDASDGGWSNYKTSGKNTMTYSEYSATNHNFSHYFMRHANAGTNIKFCIANDYSDCISDTLVSDTYTNEWLEAEANIRFMWYYGTNTLSRAYLSGSSIVSDRFLVLEGDNKLYNAAGTALTSAAGGQVSGLNENEMNLIDDQNWVYEATVQANPTARVKLTAKFNNKVQYFYGSEGTFADGTTHQLIGGTGDAKYTIRVVYDFKTNRLVCAWLPDGTDITDEFKLDADIMIIRSHQGDAQQITFDGGELSDVKTVYGAMRFNKYRLNNQSEASGHASLSLSRYERDLFFISFPFEVKLNDVFGFGTYGKHWIIEYYDGKTRAQNGFWADSPTNWKFVTTHMKDTFTLHANEGYVLALDLDELTMSSSVWNYGVDSVYLYFPSTTTVGAIQATSATVTIDQTGYQCTIGPRFAGGDDRRVKDSYWHLLGVPSYCNAEHATAISWTGTVPTVTSPATPETWTATVPYIYNWVPSTNTMSVQSTTPMTFKAMYSYLAQYSATTISWTSVNATPASVAARRAEGYKSVYELRLDLQQEGKAVDHTFVSLRDKEEVSANFDFNYDLSKMMYGAFSTASNIYTLTGDTIEVAGNCLPISETLTIVPVGVTIGANGEYTFSMPEVSADMSVILVDNELGTRIDLRLMDYAVNMTIGSYTDRFTLELSTARGAATVMESVEGADLKDGKAHKFVRDGIMYILRDGVIYDARGARMKSER